MSESRAAQGAVPPTLDARQRSQGLDEALRVRRRRGQIKGDLKAGRLRLSEAIELAAHDDAVAGIKVIDALRSLPRTGPVRAAAVMERLDIAPSRRLRGLGDHQHAALLREFEGRRV